ncbi:hypothetical protein A6769_01940 [Nostoc punctiforme NIES-2108]|uniref:Uncharacterized protein n=1 Tax=Nostoc punctiforme NIES-2108 TaxID=1356359 RepID=A0A367S0D7_NOSPU|nr:hypothetical protein A6769_01940 [Nostoc punctiforme NIES-2108]
MKIVKLILLACPAFLVSMLLVVNPANASSLKSTYATQIMTVVSTQKIPDVVTANLIQKFHPIIDQLGCNCANCVQTKFQSLQGKLPSVGF